MDRAWESFFVAQVGAAAALSGLLFVALSINLTSILLYPALVDRTAEALGFLVLPVLLGLAMLVPDIALATTGWITAIAAIGGFLFINRLLVKARAAARERPRREFRIRVTLAEIATVPAVVGAIALIA